MMYPDALSNSYVDNNQTLTFAHTVTTPANKLVVRVASWGPGRVITSVTYAGRTMALDKGVDDAGDSNYAGVWYLDNPPTGTNNIVVTATSSSAWIRAAGTSLIGARLGPANATAGAAYSGATNGKTTTIITKVDNCWIFDAITDQTADMTAVSPQIDDFDPTDTTSRGSYKKDVAAGTNSMGWTWSGTEAGAHAVAAYAPALKPITRLRPAPFKPGNRR